MNCLRCYWCGNLKEEDLMTYVGCEKGSFEFCSEKCHKEWHEDQILKHEIETTLNLNKEKKKCQ